MLLEVLEDIDDVFQSIHVVPEDEPVSQVPVRRVGHLTELVGHYVASNIVPHIQTPFDDGDLDLAQERTQLELGVFETTVELAGILLVPHHLLEANGNLLQELERVKQRIVQLEEKENISIGWF